ncbi:MAG TPA: alpha/beta hydrolase-fold protein [Microlunatus sp.]|nr:alpha/beta hydrolase-fold protein [Microlunatus sp.]
MQLTSPVLVVIGAGLALGLPILLVITWRRRPHGLTGAGLRLVGILLSQVLAIGTVLLVANNTYNFYNSWGDILGEQNGGVPAATAGNLVPADGSLGRVVSLTVRVPGAKGPSSERLPVLAWLPRQYEQRQFAKTRFPVLMLLPGQPSTPQGVFAGLDFARQATAAIDAGRVKPFVVVVPPILIDPPRDTECTNVPNGPQAETWLADNVRSQVIRKLRVERDARHWSAMGMSTGGFCAAKLLLRNPTLFGAAVSIGGYFTAETDSTTGDLFGGSAQLRRENSPSWLIKQAGARQTNLLVVVSQQDKDSYRGVSYADSAAFIAANKGTPGVATILLPSGGHSFQTYRPTVPGSLQWLMQIGSLG